MTRQDLTLGYAMGPTIPNPVSTAIERVELLESAGFDTVWLPDHLLVTPRGFMPDVWTLLPAMATATEEIDIATGVTDPHRRGPGVLAQSAATVDHVSSGRFRLGIGPGEAMTLEPFGYDWDRPVSKLVELVGLVRRLWDGETIDHDGEFFEFQDAFLQIQPETKVPIYFGANGPRTRTLSGRIADGWYPIMESPDSYETHLADVRSGMAQAGRETGDLHRGLQIPTGVSDSEEEIDRLLTYTASTLAIVPGKLSAAGYEVDFPDELVSDYFQDHLANEESERTAMALAEHVPREAAEEFGVVGTPEEIIEQIEMFHNRGVDHFAFMNMSTDPEATIEAFGSEIIPYFEGQ